MNSLFDLSGQLAVVTGCSRGIGLAIAKGLAAMGADIIGVSSSLQPGGECERAVHAEGRKFTGYAVDLGDRAQVKSWIDNVHQAHGVPNILINNAGIIRRTPAAEHRDEDWDDVMAVNLDTPFIITREFGRGMIARGSGKIVFVASLLTFQGGITVPGYAASKGGVGQLTKAFANEWAGRGVNVNAIAPGYVSTDNTAALRGDPGRAEQILARIPAKRWGEPSDFIGPVIFLVSAASNYVHGEILTVDGGWMAR